jgi:DNA-binding MarR family transcriptional regulator
MATASPHSPTPGEFDDTVVDALNRAVRQLRASLVRPPLAQVPIPSLNRPLEVAKVFACDALYELGASGDPITVQVLATALRLQHSTISRLVGQLEADGLLRRGTDPTDRRRRTLTLSAAGEAVARDSARMRRFVARCVLADWTEADVLALTATLTRLARSASARLERLPDLARVEFCGGAATLERGDRLGRGQLTRPVAPDR